MDVGTSGGVWGRQRGYSLMIGGEDVAVDRLGPVFEAIAPGVDSAARTPGRDGEPTPAERGYLHCGPNGAGHFVKMVHNGIEYAVMAAYAEGLNILKNANAGALERTADAETAPLAHPEYYRYDLDLAAVTDVFADLTTPRGNARADDQDVDLPRTQRRPIPRAHRPCRKDRPTQGRHFPQCHRPTSPRTPRRHHDQRRDRPRASEARHPPPGERTQTSLAMRRVRDLEEQLGASPVEFPPRGRTP